MLPVGTPVKAHASSWGALSEGADTNAAISLSVLQSGEDRWETRRCLPYGAVSEARKGVPNIMTMKNRAKLQSEERNQPTNREGR